MYTFSSLLAAKKYFTIGQIKHLSEAAGSHFFSPGSMKFFKDKTTNWKVFVYPNGLVFICNKNTGYVRQVFSDCRVGTNIRINREYDNLVVDNKREFDKVIPELILKGYIQEGQKVWKLATQT